MPDMSATRTEAERLMATWTFADEANAACPVTDVVFQIGDLVFLAIPILQRPSGMLIAVPSGVLPQEELDRGWLDESYVLGPSAEVEVRTLVRGSGAGPSKSHGPRSS